MTPKPVRDGGLPPGTTQAAIDATVDGPRCHRCGADAEVWDDDTGEPWCRRCDDEVSGYGELEPAR